MHRHAPAFAALVLAVILIPQLRLKFRASGLALLIVGQNVTFLDLADRVYTSDGGRVGFEGSVAALHADNALHRAYFGPKS